MSASARGGLLMQPRIVAAIVALAALAGSATGQEAAVRTVPYDGYDLFCHVLHSAGMTPVLDVPAAVSDPKGTVIIVFGRTLGAFGHHPRGILQKETEGQKLKQYLAAGGSLLVA